LTKLADESASFKSKTIMGLLRGAPDLISHVKQIEDMFQRPNGGEKSRSCPSYVTVPLTVSNLDLDELLPQKGQDVEYDMIIVEIADLEEQLQGLLEELQKQVG